MLRIVRGNRAVVWFIRPAKKRLKVQPRGRCTWHTATKSKGFLPRPFEWVRRRKVEQVRNCMSGALESSSIRYSYHPLIRQRKQLA